MKNTIKYIINDKPFSFKFEGDLERGDDTILIHQDNNLLENTEWDDLGFTIQPFLSQNENFQFKKAAEKTIKDLIIKNGGTLTNDFKLDNYHKFVNDEIHLNIAREIKNGWKSTDFPFDVNLINQRLSEILGKKVSTKSKDENINDFYLRIVRPNSLQDNNPPHRDVWLERLRNAINIYHPVCGSTSDSALPILPKSHKLKESALVRTSKGAILNNTEYTVPCAIAINDETIKMIRPNPTDDEVLVFSPYLVHGGGYNTNIDKTRISLEMRFWKVED
jgi:hypothetical protein